MEEEEKTIPGHGKKLEKEFKELEQRHSAVLQSARQIFSIAINCLQQLHNIKDGNTVGENMVDTIKNYKIQLGKYNKVLKSEGADRSELFCETVMFEHKKKLISAKDKNNVEGIIEVLLSLRVNALQISPELRKNLVYELIRNDLFLIAAKRNNNFLLDLLTIPSTGLKHALYAMISVIVSTLKGVEYIVENNTSILQRIIDVRLLFKLWIAVEGAEGWISRTKILCSYSSKDEHKRKSSRPSVKEQANRVDSKVIRKINHD